MTPERWQQLKGLFGAALERNGEERTSFLAQACAGDPSLLAEIDSLLVSHESSGGLLDTPAVAQEGLAGPGAPDPAPRRIGPYELVREIGSGGMGTVHLAARADQQYRKQVAIKLIRRGMDTELVVSRFRNERQILAGLVHSNIAALLDGGTTEDGLPYFVMEHIEGLPIDRYCEDRRLSISQRLELFLAVCRAVAHAHASLVVHRDLKPGNILVTPEGNPKLLDFGLAKLLDPAAPADRTATQARMFTPAFASPEQCRGGTITTATDVYSLGVVLYVLLTGRRPYGSKTDSLEELMRAVCEAEPPRPSAIARRLSRDLDTIALKAIEKEPGRRYASVEQLGEDIRRHLEGRPIKARPGSVPYKAGKFILRHRVGAAATALLLAAGGWTLWSSRQAGLAALEAARLGALAESMEAQLRMEHLAPPHDLRPAVARIRAEVEALRPLAAGGAGPANFALGKGLELVGDVEGARAAYERAWAAGFRTPRVAEGLGTMLGRLYQRSHERVQETLEPAAREERLSVLRLELRAPALRYLGLAQAAGWRASFLSASIALLEGDHAAARARAQEGLAVAPERYELKGLQAQAWIEEALQLNDRSMDQSLAALAPAEALLEDALRWGRSDPTLAIALARIRVDRLNQRVRRGQPLLTELPASLAALDAASALNPDDPSLLQRRANLWMAKVQESMMTDPAAVLPQLDEAAALFRRAAQLDGGEPRSLCRLAFCLYYRAFRLNEMQADALPTVEEGLRTMELAAVRAPKDPEVHFTRFVLHTVEAEALKIAGKPSASAWREAVKSGEEALRLRTHRAASIPAGIAEALLNLAKEGWQRGQDPRADFERALATLEDAYRKMPGEPWVSSKVAQSRVEAAEVLMAAGEDVRPHVERALAVLDEVLARRPDLTYFQANKGALLVFEALRREAAGEDPTAVLADAQVWLDKATKSADDVPIQVAQAQVPLIEARWSASRGGASTEALARAERRLEAFVRRYPKNPTGHRLLASCALERASWLRRKGLPSAEVAREGLAHLARALEKEPRDPLHSIQKARLEVLAGDRAQARQSLLRAWAINPLVKGGRESKRADVEIGH